MISTSIHAGSRLFSQPKHTYDTLLKPKRFSQFNDGASANPSRCFLLKESTGGATS